MKHLPLMKCCGFILALACAGPTAYDKRNKNSLAKLEAKGEQKSEQSADLETIEDSSQANGPVNSQAPIITSDTLIVLKLAAPVNTSGVAANFVQSIQGLHTVAPGKTLIYAKNNTTAVAESQGALKKLTSALNIPPGTELYLTEKDRFWLFDKTSIAYPAQQASSDLGQVALLNISPDLLKAGNPQLKKLFVGPKQMVLAVDSRINILGLEGDRVRVLSFTLPKNKDAPVVAYAAGLTSVPDTFWFLTPEHILVLNKNAKGEYNWYVSPFKFEIAGQTEPLQSTRVAMLVEFKDNSISFPSQVVIEAGGQLFAKEPMNLVPEDPKLAAISQDFVANVQPLLANNCAACHPGIDTEQSARDKATAIKTYLINKTMPPAAPLSDGDSQKILNWYDSIPL